MSHATPFAQHQQLIGGVVGVDAVGCRAVATRAVASRERAADGVILRVEYLREQLAPLQWTWPLKLDAIEEARRGGELEADARRGLPSVSRSQLLVLSFNSLILDTAASIKNITAHYGLPQVLSNMNSLPEENSQDSPRKLVSIRCSTRDKAAGDYAPWNQKLYARLATDKGTGKAPSLEPHFPHFDPNAVDCGDRERSLSEYTAELDIRSWYERAHRRPPSAELLSNLLAPHEPVTAP